MSEALDALKAEREAREAKRAETLAAREEADAIAAEQAKIAELDIVEKLEAENKVELGKSLWIARTPMGPVLVKRPHQATLRRFLDAGKRDSASLLALVRPCVVHPSLGDFDNLIKEYFGCVPNLADGIVTMSGFSQKETEGK